MLSKKKRQKRQQPVMINNTKKNVSFRLDAETINKISVIAKNKKSTKTKVITELIRLAHIGLYSKPAKLLNDFYLKLLEKETQEGKHNKKKKASN